MAGLKTINELFKLCIRLSVVVFLSIGLSSSSSEVSEELLDLKDAIDFCEEEEVERLVTAYPQLIHAEYQPLLWKTPLHFAAAAGSLAIVRVLIERGADVQARDNNGTTALHEAALAGEGDILNYLLERGADVDAICCVLRPGTFKMRCWQSGTPLHIAISNQHTDIVKQLCQYGADLDVVVKADADSVRSTIQTALDCYKEFAQASRRRRTMVNILCYLLQQGALISDGERDEINTVFSNFDETASCKHTIQEEREAIGKALQESENSTGMPRDLTQLLLSFLSAHLHMPDSKTSTQKQKLRGCLDAMLSSLHAWWYGK